MPTGPEPLPHPGGTVAGPDAWRRNRQVAWTCAVLGVLTGLVMGLWSFDGPMPVPPWLGDYGATARRLARLGHIAFLGLGILNLLLVRELAETSLGMAERRVAATAMNIGNVFLPLVLFAAAAWQPLKYLLPVPACSVFIALVLAARGTFQRPPVRTNAGNPT